MASDRRPGLAFIFRGDDRYTTGDVGLALGPPADEADIQDAADHVLRKESRRSSRFTSFSTELKIARRFTTFDDPRNIRKVDLAHLASLEARGTIRLLGPDRVFEQLVAGTRRQGKQAADVRAAMRRNHEVLVEGCIPAEFVLLVH